MTATQRETPAMPPQVADAPDPQYDLAHAIGLTLECLAAARLDSHTTSEARNAQLYLYERIMNYYALMRKRTLSASIEFLTPYSDGKRGATTAGWYYRGVPNGAQNWYGPYGSPRLAAHARDKNHPRTRMAFVEQQLDLMALEEEAQP